MNNKSMKERKPRVLKVCINEWLYASRDQRELSVYKNAGAEVLVLAKGKKTSDFPEDVNGFSVYRCTSKPLGDRVPSFLNRVASVFVWVRHIRKRHADFLSCHDLGALALGWMSTLGMKNKPQLIYDSHEFEIYRINRTRLQQSFIKLAEGYLIKKCVFSVVVNDSIANAVQKIHGLEEKPLVIRSIPQKWNVNEEVCNDKREELLSKMPGGRNVEHLLMFHGNMGKGRGIECAIHALSVAENVGIVLMGRQTNSGLIDEINAIAGQYDALDRLLFIDAVPYEDIWKYAGAVDIEIMMVESISKSYHYALPNKMFESIQSMTPIISSDLPEMERIVKKYGIGLVCHEGDIEGMKSAVLKLCTDKELYFQIKDNLRKAKEILCWENEQKKLIEKFYNVSGLEERHC